MRPSLQRHALQRDAERFCGRTRETALLERVLDDDGPASVMLIHGPGGIGKSTLLREFVRRADARGYQVASVDGRESVQLEPALAALRDADRPLLVIDSFERVAAVGAHLREHVLADLPDTTRVLIAGRSAPEASWSQDGWEAITLELELTALSDAEARELLARRGLQDSAAIGRLVRWARGLPLALAVGADGVIARGGRLAGGPSLALDRMDTDAGLAATLLRRLAGDELHGADQDVLAVAAIAVAVDARLLGSVLPGVDSDHAETWLRSLTFSEGRGTRVALHERVRDAVRRDLVERDPDHERALRRAIADHLHDRTVYGESWLLGELAGLLADPVLRWTVAGATDRHHLDRVRDGDDAGAAAALGASGTAWWAGVSRFMREAPQRVSVVRDSSGRLAGMGIAVTPANAPDWCGEDPILGPWLAHARVHWPDGNVLLWRDAFDFQDSSPDGESAVSALLYTAISQLGGLPNVRCFYGSVASDDARARHRSAAIGAVAIPELTVADGERRIECHVLDHGPGGMVGTVRALIYRDLGLPDPTLRASPPHADVVRDALRAFHDPVALAANPLARGATTVARAESVRALLREAMVASFGDSADEQLQRATIERGYLDADGGHDRAALELSISRTTYFRRLAAATGRVTDYVLAQLGSARLPNSGATASGRWIRDESGRIEDEGARA